ncbi:MAG: hypothetical protein ACYC4P_11655 [Thermoanaerobaculia bacterium]
MSATNKERARDGAPDTTEPMHAEGKAEVVLASTVAPVPVALTDLEAIVERLLSGYRQRAIAESEAK